MGTLMVWAWLAGLGGEQVKAAREAMTEVGPLS